MEFFNNLFNNIGHTIKSIARFTAIAGTIYTIIMGIMQIIQLGLVWSITSIISGLIGTWMAALLLYAFGHLVEKVEEIAENTRYR